MKIRFANIDNSITCMVKFRNISTFPGGVIIMFSGVAHCARFDTKLGTFVFNGQHRNGKPVTSYQSDMRWLICVDLRRLLFGHSLILMYYLAAGNRGVCVWSVAYFSSFPLSNLRIPSEKSNKKRGNLITRRLHTQKGIASVLPKPFFDRYAHFQTSTGGLLWLTFTFFMQKTKMKTLRTSGAIQTVHITFPDFSFHSPAPFRTLPGIWIIPWIESGREWLKEQQIKLSDRSNWVGGKRRIDSSLGAFQSYPQFQSAVCRSFRRCMQRQSMLILMSGKLSFTIQG